MDTNTWKKRTQGNIVCRFGTVNIATAKQDVPTGFLKRDNRELPCCTSALTGTIHIVEANCYLETPLSIASLSGRTVEEGKEQ